MTTIAQLVATHKVSSLAIGLTGKWRPGPEQNEQAEKALKLLRDEYKTCVHVVSEQNEREWELASACQAVSVLVPSAEYRTVCSIGSGSSTTQMGRRHRSTGLDSSVALPLGIHAKTTDVDSLRHKFTDIIAAQSKWIRD